MQRIPGYIDNPLPPHLASYHQNTRPPPPPPAGVRQPSIPNGTGHYPGEVNSISWSSTSGSTNPFDLPEQDQDRSWLPTETPPTLPPAYDYTPNSVSGSSSWGLYPPVVQASEGHLNPQQYARQRVRSMSERGEWGGGVSTFGPASMAFPMPETPLSHSFSSMKLTPPVPPVPPLPPLPQQTSSQPPPSPPPRPPPPPSSSASSTSNVPSQDVSGSSNTPTTLERATTATATTVSHRISRTNIHVSRSNSESLAESAPASPPHRPNPHPHSKSDRGVFSNTNLLKLQGTVVNPSVPLFQPSNSYSKNPEQYPDALASPVDSTFSVDQESVIASELMGLSQDMSENIRRFQANELSESDQEWHKLVPKEALDALDPAEVKRQSMIFEFFKAEREYVSDLELVTEVFMKGMKEAQPAVIPEHLIGGFLHEVFGNVADLLKHHKVMLESLFERQREYHPLVHSISDIVLETALKPEFRGAYEIYIKHFPVAESLHQKQLSSNKRYASFLESVSSDPRVKKRDMKIFLSRPVTRLPRLNLLLESMLKQTNKEHDHPDLDTLPLVLGILGDCIKATQPGIETAERRVKFMDLCEHLVPGKGEITDMDLFDKERHLVYSGPVWMKGKSDNGFSDKWQELQAALLDNYFIIYQEERISPTVTKKIQTHRPIPLSFVRLASFNSDPDIRKEKEGGIFQTKDVPMYPFTFYHASLAHMKAFKLYVNSDAVRKKWYSSFVDALGVHQVKQESNPWYTQTQLVDGFFRIPREAVITPHSKATGRIVCAAPFGWYKALQFPSINYVTVLQGINNLVFNKFIIHYDTNVVSYSLDLLAMVAIGQGNPRMLEASRETVTPADHSVMFIRQVVMMDRVLWLIPKEAYDVVALTRTLGICTRDGIVTAGPSNLAGASTLPIPTILDSSPASVRLKSQIDGARPLGFLLVSSEEIMVVYDDLGCYVDTRGRPTRKCGYIRWETKVTSYAVRNAFLLLISSRNIEIRNIANGRLLQVIEGGDIRLLFSEPCLKPQDNVLVAMRGRFNDSQGLSEKVVELVLAEDPATAQSPNGNGSHPNAHMWADWDM
ncbi:signal transducer [Coprinopsis cinerea okayama7|uniref:Signal transducer n=1 Tax=Coprinopsis cinerea (strain Okayama-7 / 130 / ATCC MYA-4618 / FGSC 9003) TaxID=240176 RepID=A8NUF6_COPC7|nr:signal transducer [Coprinopsis cinerea okayama7\|eukprot:XP_001836445.2 signal transducer [Coprinopsis cinerea okayama7\